VTVYHAVFIVNLICWGFMVTSFFSAMRCYGASITNFPGLSPLIPSCQKTSEGKVWAKRYWYSIASIILSFALLAAVAPAYQGVVK